MSWVITPTLTWNETIWNPSMITTALWLDAADASTVTTVSGAVSQWNDKSGNGRNASQPTAGSRPAYQGTGLNSRPALSYNGSNNILGFTDRSLGQNVSALSYFIVFIANAPSTPDFRALFDMNTNGIPDRATIYPRSNAFEAGGRRLDADSFQFQQSGTLSTSATIGSAIFNYSAATLGVSVNGAALTFRSGGFQTSGNTSNTSSTFIGIGGSVSPEFQFQTTSSQTGGCNCIISEFVCLQSASSDTNRQKIEGYLAHKWGLTANLPNDHPYKTVGPTP